MPFIYGAGIAYILKPICNTYERFLEKHWHPKRQKLIGTASVVGSVVTGLVIIYAVLAMLLPAAGCEHIQNGTVAAADGGQYQQYGGSFV